MRRVPGGVLWVVGLWACRGQVAEVALAPDAGVAPSTEVVVPSTKVVAPSTEVVSPSTEVVVPRAEAPAGVAAVEGVFPCGASLGKVGPDQVAVSVQTAPDVWTVWLGRGGELRDTGLVGTVVAWSKTGPILCQEEGFLQVDARGKARRWGPAETPEAWSPWVGDCNYDAVFWQGSLVIWEPAGEGARLHPDGRIESLACSDGNQRLAPVGQRLLAGVVHNYGDECNSGDDRLHVQALVGAQWVDLPEVRDDDENGVTMVDVGLVGQVGGWFNGIDDTRQLWALHAGRRPVRLLALGEGEIVHGPGNVFHHNGTFYRLRGARPPVVLARAPFEHLNRIALVGDDLYVEAEGLHHFHPRTGWRVVMETCR